MHVRFVRQPTKFQRWSLYGGSAFLSVGIVVAWAAFMQGAFAGVTDVFKAGYGDVSLQAQDTLEALKPAATPPALPLAGEESELRPSATGDTEIRSALTELLKKQN